MLADQMTYLRTTCGQSRSRRAWRKSGVRAPLWITLVVEFRSGDCRARSRFEATSAKWILRQVLYRRVPRDTSSVQRGASRCNDRWLRDAATSGHGGLLCPTSLSRGDCWSLRHRRRPGTLSDKGRRQGRRRYVGVIMFQSVAHAVDSDDAAQTPLRETPRTHRTAASGSGRGFGLTTGFSFFLSRGLRLIARTFDIHALCFERASNTAAISSRAKSHCSARSHRGVAIPQDTVAAGSVWSPPRTVLQTGLSAYLYRSEAFRGALHRSLSSGPSILVQRRQRTLAGYLPACRGDSRRLRASQRGAD